MSRCCAKCGDTKPLEQFVSDKRNSSGRGSYCLPCNRERQTEVQRRFRAKNPGYDASAIAEKRKDPEYLEREKQKAREWYHANRDEQKARKLALYHRRKHVGKKWVEDNRDKVRATYARYRAAKLRACPEWSDQHAIAAIYTEAQRLSELRGERLHVDHIIPLQGETVCGLHVHWNLQILTASENQSKRNRLIEADALAA